MSLEWVNEGSEGVEGGDEGYKQGGGGKVRIEAGVGGGRRS